MESTYALDAEATQAFLNRIYPYNTEDLPEYDVSALAGELDTARCSSVGRTALGTVPVQVQGKIPGAESISEETQEMAIPVLPDTTAVLVKTVRLSADPCLVPFGEDPHNYPRGNRQRFFLAEVLD